MPCNKLSLSYEMKLTPTLTRNVPQFPSFIHHDFAVTNYENNFVFQERNALIQTAK